MPLIPLSLERLTIANLERERSLLEDQTIDQTLERRIRAGMYAARVGAGLNFEWRPIYASALAVMIDLADETVTELDQAADEIGFTLQILAAAFAVSDYCKPRELLQIELEAARWPEKVKTGRILRSEPGRGNIYDAHFELPGYQLAFLGLLGGNEIPQSRILEEAFLALASRVCATDSVAGRPLSVEARDMAARMLAMAETRNAWRAPNSGKVSRKRTAMKAQSR